MLSSRFALLRGRNALAALLVLFLCSFSMFSATTADASTAELGQFPLLDYRPPTDAAIVDRFRPPPKPWMAGNRGIDFATTPGAQISASAEGRVIFAGAVGGQLHVTIEHPDGLRSSYSFLESLTVSAGDRVKGGDTIGIAGGPFHFGVRNPDGEYLDPEAVLAGSLRPSARLVPGTDQGLDRLGANERRALLDVFLDTGAAALSASTNWSMRTTALVAHYAVELNPTTHAQRLAIALDQWFEDRKNCTSASMSVPAHETSRIAVLVSGLGTSSDGNTAWEIDTQALGYSTDEVVRYSYEGGQAPRVEAPMSVDVDSGSSQSFDAIATRPFDALDSQQPVGRSAEHLAVLLQSVAASRPGVPIDVIAHSQGGVVARLAVERAGADARLPTEVETLVTVSSPQQGAPLATAVLALDGSPGGAGALSQVRAAGLADDLDHRLAAITDLAETSPIIDELHARPMPAGVRFVTIAGSGDLVVPGAVAVDPVADARIILPTPIGTETHGSLPSSPAATREIGLAVAGLGPTCQSIGDAVLALATAEAIRYGESAAGATTALGAWFLAIPPAE